MLRTAVLLAGIAMLSAHAQPPGPSANHEIEDRLRGVLSEFRGEAGIAAQNLDSGDVIAVNADARFPTASTIKTAVMVEAYHQAAEGRIAMDEEIRLRASDKVGGSGVLRDLSDGLAFTVRDLVHLMIALSDNTATNMLIERLGTVRVNDRLAALGFEETRLFRPTFRDGRADVLPGLEREFGLGMTTPREMSRLMALIADGKAVDARASAEMLAILRRQQDRAMIPRLLPADVQVGNKTGTDEEKHAGQDGVKRHVRADAAIVTGPGVRYTIAICMRQIEDTRWSVENEALVTGARIARMIDDHFTR